MLHTSDTPTVDGFPLSETDADYHLQLLIDADLRVCRATQAAFEEAFPPDPSEGTARFVERLHQRPKPYALYPALHARKAFQEWLMPAVRRFAWNWNRGEPGSVWMADTAGMIRIILSEVRYVTEEEFLALAGQREGLLPRCYGYLEGLRRFAGGLERDALLSGNVIATLRELMIPGGKHDPYDRAQIFGWLLFRAADGFDDHDPCWSARVRRELAAFKSKERALWLRVLNGESGSETPTQNCLAAIKRLESAPFEAGLRRWIEMLRDGRELRLSPFGVMLLKQVIAICGQLKEAACYEALYDIARAPWMRKEEVARWLYTFLRVLEKRSDDRVFACLEALAMNPVTATDEVRRKYEALLNALGAAALPVAATGIDGFPMERDPALREHHARIDQLFRMGANAAARGQYQGPAETARIAALRAIQDGDMKIAAARWADQLEAPRSWFYGGPEVEASLRALQNAILQEFSADPGSLHVAAADRLEWIATHEQRFSKDTVMVWRQSLSGLGCGGGLLQRSLREVEKLPLESLLRAIKAGPGSMKVFELCQRYVAEHGWSIELVEPLRKWVSTLGTSHTDNYYRAKIEWFLWFEDVAPIALDACWSYRVKQDLRGMTADERAAWVGLLDNVTFVIADRPAKKWFTSAGAAFAKIDGDDFRRRFVSWFAPFENGEPLRLTITGRNVLRLLMWYALFAKDDAVDKALAGFANAKWKTKQLEKRVAQAEMAFAYVLAERTPKTALPILERMVSSGNAFSGSSTEKIYRKLCADFGHQPIQAVEQSVRPENKVAENGFDPLPASRSDHSTRRR